MHEVIIFQVFSHGGEVWDSNNSSSCTSTMRIEPRFSFSESESSKVPWLQGNYKGRNYLLSDTDHDRSSSYMTEAPDLSGFNGDHWHVGTT